MNITTQSVRFNTPSHNTSIYLSRPIWSERTTVQFIRDGWFVNIELETFDSKEDALSFGLTVIKNFISEGVTSVNIEVSSEMLTTQEVMAVLVEDGFQSTTVNLI